MNARHLRTIGRQLARAVLPALTLPLSVPLTLFLSVPAAQAQMGPDWSASLEESVRQQFSQLQPTQADKLASDLKIDVKLGAIDPRLQLAPCQRIEPFLPTGARLWGRSVIGVKCLSGANWSITVPVQVTVTGPALVAAANLSSGITPGEQDFKVAVVELSREPGQPVLDASQIQGRVLSRNLAAGQILRADHLRQLPAVNPGDAVKVKVTGNGFVLVYDGVAINSAAEGQIIRVRGENGKVMSGLLRDRSLQIQM